MRSYVCDDGSCCAEDDGWDCRLSTWERMDGSVAVALTLYAPDGKELHSGNARLRCTTEDAELALETGRQLLCSFQEGAADDAV